LLVILAAQTTLVKIVKYTSEYKDQWNAVIKQSMNGCFLHERDFMEYHSDRFEDHSLLFFEDEVLTACFPAHVSNNVLYSHRGLTYAGLIAIAKTESYSEYLQTLISYCNKENFYSLEIKLPPKFHDPTFDVHFKELKNSGLEKTSESVDLFVDLTKEWLPSSKKTAGYRNGKFEGLELIKNDDLEIFWKDLLVPQLSQRHDAKPVHTLEEIQLLKSRFPDQILQYTVAMEGNKVAGITLFDFSSVLKIQYAAANATGFDNNAMDFLYLEIIKEARDSKKQFVDLGTVNNTDTSINEGLLRFKKQLGGQVTPVYTMKLDLHS